MHTSEIPSTNRKSKASSRMHRGSCITRRKASARKARKPNRTSHCQRPHKHAEQLLLSRIQSHAEGDESAKKKTPEFNILKCPYSAADVWNLRQGKRGGYFHSEGLPNGNGAPFSEAAATLVPEAMSISKLQQAYYFQENVLNRCLNSPKWPAQKTTGDSSTDGLKDEVQNPW